MKFVYVFVLCILYTLPWTSYGLPAKYEGRSPADAGHILDISQNKRGFGGSAKGHARNHASGPGLDSVESFSRKGKRPRCGFNSRDEQNQAAHAALSHPRAQQAMNKLNQYNGADCSGIEHQRQTIEFSNTELNLGTMRAAKYKKGSKKTSFPIGSAVLVMQHHKDQQGNPKAPVHVQTFYPKASQPNSPPQSPKRPASPQSPKSPKRPKTP